MAAGFKKKGKKRGKKKKEDRPEGASDFKSVLRPYNMQIAMQLRPLLETLHSRGDQGFP